MDGLANAEEAALGTNPNDSDSDDDGTRLDIEWEKVKVIYQLGLKHGNEFVRVAIHGNKRWQEIAARVGSWFVSGEVRYFDRRDDALAWLMAEG